MAVYKNISDTSSFNPGFVYSEFQSGIQTAEQSLYDLANYLSVTTPLNGIEKYTDGFGANWANGTHLWFAGSKTGPNSYKLTDVDIQSGNLSFGLMGAVTLHVAPGNNEITYLSASEVWMSSGDGQWNVDYRGSLNVTLDDITGTINVAGSVKTVFLVSGTGSVSEPAQYLKLIGSATMNAGEITAGKITGYEWGTMVFDTDTSPISFSKAGSVSGINIDASSLSSALSADGFNALMQLAVFSGNDIISGTAGDDHLDGGEGNDMIDGGEGNNSIVGGEGNNNITSGSGNDTITGGSGHDKIVAGDGNNTITAGDGNNNIASGSGNDTITGGSGHDKIVAGDGTNIITAGDGNNNISAGTNDDLVTVGNDNNKILAGDGNNIVTAGDGNNNITGGNGDGIAHTMSESGAVWGNDIYAGNGNNIITTGTDDDLIDLGDGNNIVKTGLGDDKILVGSGKNTINAGDGNNIVETGRESAQNGNNNITTGTGNDEVYAWNGNDTAKLGAGSDYANLGAGKNTIDMGLDQVTDTLVFGTDFFAAITDNNVASIAFNTVTNFNLGDELVFDFANLASMLTPDQVSTVSNLNNLTNDFLYLNATSGKLYYDADGSDGTAASAVQIGQISGAGLKGDLQVSIVGTDVTIHSSTWPV